MRVICYMATLMWYARELGQAELSGDETRIAAARKAHDDYRDACLSADELIVGRVGDLRWAEK